MAQDYTLKLNIAADGSQAIAEARRVQRELQAAAQQQRQQQAGGQDGAAGGQEVAAALGRIETNVDGALGRIEHSVAGVLGSIEKSVSGAMGEFGKAAQQQRQQAQQQGNPASPAAKTGGWFSGAGSVLGGIGKAFTVVFGVFKAALSGAFALVRGFAAFLAAPFRMAWGAAGMAIRGVLYALGTLTAAMWGLKKVLDPAARFQDNQFKLAARLRNPRMARIMMGQLRGFANMTGFSHDDVFAAGQRLSVRDAYSWRTMKAAGETATYLDRSLADVAGVLAQVSGSRKGRRIQGALEGLRDLGVTRSDLRRHGVRFRRNGTLRSSTRRAREAAVETLMERYGGSMDWHNRTWKSALDDIRNAWESLCQSLGGALAPLTKFVKSSVVPTIYAMGAALARIDWNKALEGPLRFLSAVSVIARNWASPDPETSGKGMGQAAAMWDGFKEVGKAFAEGIGDVLKGYFKSIAETIGNFAGNGGLKALFGLLGDIMTASFKVGAAMLKTTLGGLGMDFIEKIDNILRHIPRLKYKGMYAGREGELKAQFVRMMNDGAGRNPSARLDVVSPEFYKEMGQWLEDRYYKDKSILNQERMTSEDHVPGDEWQTYREFYGKDIDALSTNELNRVITDLMPEFEEHFKDRWGHFNNERLKAQWNAEEEAAWKEAAGRLDKVVDGFADVAGKFADALTVGPLRDAVKGLGGKVSDAWGKSVTPVVDSVLGKTPKAPSDAIVRAAYGAGAASLVKEFRKSAGLKPRDAAPAQAQPQAGEAKKAQQDTVVSIGRVEKGIAALSKKFDDIRRLVDPISKAYAAA